MRRLAAGGLIDRTREAGVHFDGRRLPAHPADAEVTPMNTPAAAATPGPTPPPNPASPNTTALPSRLPKIASRTPAFPPNRPTRTAAPKQAKRKENTSGAAWSAAAHAF